ncbi:MAG: ribonuclease R [Devosia sp.]|nr:ribonuclease R [Devosia sp.]
MTSSPKTKSAPRHRAFVTGTLPTREDVLAAMAEDPGLDGKRDLAKRFGIKGDMRTPFKVLLKQMEAEGFLTRSRKAIRRTATLPAVTVLDIPADADPENLHAFPANWNEEEGERPRVTIITPPRARVVAGPGDRILARIEAGDGALPVYTAQAMKILDKPRRGQIGVVRLDADGAVLEPVDRKQREMRIERGDLGEAKEGDLVEVEVRVTGRLMIPKARVIAVIGNPKTERAVSLIAIHNLDIPYRFPAGVLREAEEAGETSLKGREDWRQIPLITIDPADAKDHDDAVYAEPDTDPKNAGGFIVHVAIADVAAYVRPGTALDREAYLRGNSVYFPDRVVPMLPERISNDLCSLKPGVNRPALAVRLVIGADGRKKSHSFHRVMFRSAAKLSYLEAQAAMDGEANATTGPILDTILKPLWAAYRIMATARDRRGPLDLDLPERKILLDDQGLVENVHVPPRLEAHRLIEEMMIAANVAAAETLEKVRTPLIYRTHDTPSREKLTALREFLSTLDLPFANTEAVRPADFNRILAKARTDGKIQQVSEMVLRSQAQAEYSADNYGHFGLNLDRYAHFTSPIRRYADLIVHRALITGLGLGKDGLSEGEAEKLTPIAQHISSTERRAMIAERETVDRLLAQFLAGKIGASFEGKISGVTRSGLFVRLSETGADGFIPASTIGHDYYQYIEEQQAMIGQATGERFRLGDPVTVKLVEAAPVAGALRFELLSEGPRVKLTSSLRRAKRPYRAHPSKGRKR